MSLDDKHHRDGFTQRELTVEVDGGSPRHLTHFQFELWPNYGVPKGTKELSSFVELIMDRTKEEGRKNMVVHCSGED